MSLDFTEAEIDLMNSMPDEWTSEHRVAVLRFIYEQEAIDNMRGLMKRIRENDE